MSTALPPPWQRALKTPFRELLAEGLTGSLDWRVTLAKAEVPEPIAEVIGSVVRKSGLWSNEKRAVTSELLAHFQDGLDAGAAAEELVESFGDPATAAKLIRRAKVRCRSTLWHAWWWSSRSLLAACVVYLVYGGYLLTQHPNPSVDYLGVINSAALDAPVEQTGWPLYREALVSLQQSADQRAGWSAKQAGGRPSRWGPEHGEWLGETYSQLAPVPKETADAWLDDHRKEIELFREAAGHPRMGVAAAPLAGLSEEFRELFQFGEPSEADDRADYLFMILLPHVQEARAIAQALYTDLTRAANQDDDTTALEDLQAILGVARHAGEQRCLVSGLVGVAIQRKAIDAVTWTIREHPELWSDRQLQVIAHELAKPPRPLRFYLEGELAMELDFVQRVYSKQGTLTLEGLRRLEEEGADLSVGLRLFEKPEPKLTMRCLRLLALPGYAIGLPGRTETTQVLETIIDLAIHESELPLWEPKKRRLREDVEKLFTFRNVVAALVAPANKSAQVSYKQTEGRRQGVLIGIALELARRESGAWPESLDGLAPRYLPELPIDLINGGPLGYRLVEGKPVVYSLGVDRDDDGGRLPAACDPGATRNQGSAWRGGYRPGPPFDREMTEDSAFWADGDWVLWSLADLRYVPDTKAGSE